MVDAPGNDLFRLAQQLIERTKAGKMSWSSIGEDGFAFAGTKASVVIRSRDKDQVHPYIFTLFEGDIEVDSITSGWNASPTGFEDEGSPLPWNDALENLYRSARRNALNLDQLIESILEDIDKPGT